MQILTHKLAGDIALLHAARSQAREGFNNSRSLEAGSDEAVKSIGHAEGVAQILRHNIVQGRRVEGKEALRMLSVSPKFKSLADGCDRVTDPQGHRTRR
jgi:hypothetical protein